MRIIILLLLFITTSCSNQKITLFYYYGPDLNKNNTLGSSLRIFFEKEKGMNAVQINNSGLKNDLLMIKEKVISTDKIIVPDDGNYTFAFIIKKDTLFADDRLEFWRYGDRGVYFKLDDFEKKKILKHYKIHPDQW